MRAGRPANRRTDLLLAIMSDRDRSQLNLPKFSSLHQLTVAIKGAGQRGDWTGAIQLLEGVEDHNSLRGL